MLAGLLLSIAGALPLATAHISIFHPSMYGFNVTNPDPSFSYDNRPVAPLTDYTFDQWWFHGHLGFPPNEGDYFDLPAGQTVTTELACDKGLTSYFASSPGGDVRDGNNPCPGPNNTFDPTGGMHTTGFDDLKGCALAIAYESDVTKIQPENFTVFSVNQTCVWTRFTDFQVPERMPPCPPGGCHCAWFWIHSADSGGEQNFMTGFKCNITGSTSDVALAQPQVARRCGADPAFGKPDASPGNCTYGAKQPLYWFQKERNNMFEGTYAPPFYLDLYNYKDGAQNDIFVDSYPGGLPPPSPNSTFIPTPFLGNSTPQSTAAAGSSSSAAYGSSYTYSAGASSSSASASATSSSSSPAFSSATSAASQSAADSSESVSVTTSVATSTVVSTVLVTVTATTSQAAQSTGSASSSFVSSSSLSSTSIGVTTASSSQSASQAGSTIVLSNNQASSSANSSAIYAATGTDDAAQSSSNGTTKTITLENMDVVHPKPMVLAADASTTGTVCKRDGLRKVFRRRALPSTEVESDERTETGQESSVVARMGLHRHRQLKNRSRLWSFF